MEQTDEEVERCYEEFYEDVHTEFLKFGEIVNFKVCRNGSFHLRGNVYVHYKSLDSAILAYRSLNGRYFASKQITCEYVGVTKWKVAICGEYMRSRLQTCSRGTTCNFIHCFRNPGGDYEWADWDRPAPRYWVKKMAYLFGTSDENYDEHLVPETWGKQEGSERKTPRSDRYRSRRSRSRTVDSSSSSDEKRDKGRSHSSRQRDSRRSRSMRSSFEHRRYEENLNHENDRYQESEDRLDRHGDRQNSQARERHSRTQADYLYDQGDETECHSSDRNRTDRKDSHRRDNSSARNRVDRKDSHRKDNSSRRRKHSDERPDFTKSDDGNLSVSPGRYDPSGSCNFDENIDQCNDLEKSSCHAEHGRSRSSRSEEKKSSEKLYNRDSSKHSDRSRKRKHSNSQEEETGSFEEDHYHKENKNVKGQKHRRDDHNQKKKEYKPTKEINAERFSPKESTRRSDHVNQEETTDLSQDNPSHKFPMRKSGDIIASSDETYGSRKHENGGKRERKHTKRSNDNTSSRDVGSVKHRSSRKRSRSRSPVKSTGKSRRE